MSQGAQKNYLFVSNHCNHSKKLLQQLQNTKILNDLQIINIDDKRIQLPAFVQCVPTLYIPSKRHVITDNDLFQWINEALKEETSNKDKINMADIKFLNNIWLFPIREEQIELIVYFLY